MQQQINYNPFAHGRALSTQQSQKMGISSFKSYLNSRPSHMILAWMKTCSHCKPLVDAVKKRYGTLEAAEPMGVKFVEADQINNDELNGYPSAYFMSGQDLRKVEGQEADKMVFNRLRMQAA